MGAGEGTSLVLDANDRVHIGYGSPGDLKYAYQDSSGWHIEVAALNSDDQISLALDENGYAHMSLYRTPEHDLVYVYQNLHGWNTEVVDSEGDVGLYSSLVLDENGYPHVSYYDQSTGKLKYAYQDASGWHIETVGDGGFYTSLALDTAGYPHISYHKFAGYWFGNLDYAYQDAIGWHIETVASGAWHNTSIALDQNDNPRISYYDNFSKDLKYVYYLVFDHAAHLPLVHKSATVLQDQVAVR